MAPHGEKEIQHAYNFAYCKRHIHHEFKAQAYNIIQSRNVNSSGGFANPAGSAVHLPIYPPSHEPVATAAT